MHVVNNMPPYSSSVNAISKFPETATALGVTLDELNNVILTAPCGIEDVLSLQVKPTAHFLKSKERLHMYKNRVIKRIGKVSGLASQSHIRNLERVPLIYRSTLFFISKMYDCFCKSICFLIMR